MRAGEEGALPVLHFDLNGENVCSEQMLYGIPRLTVLLLDYSNSSRNTLTFLSTRLCLSLYHKDVIAVDRSGPI